MTGRVSSIAKAVLAAAALSTRSNRQPSPRVPDKPVRIQLGFAAGGGADILARWYADKLSKLSNATFIIENKVGASGNVALDATAKAKPDGLTLMFALDCDHGRQRGGVQKHADGRDQGHRADRSFAETPFVLCVAPD